MFKRTIIVTFLALVVLMPLLTSPKIIYGWFYEWYEVYEDIVVGYDPITLDPANCYDTASAELLSNVYDTLIALDGERYDVFVPALAEQVWIGPKPPDAPEYANFAIYFKIREGVKFHTWSRSDLGDYHWDQYYLTPEDVEHSFERMLVYDYPGGPQWRLYEHLLGVYGADPSDPTFGYKIDNAVQSNITELWFLIKEDIVTVPINQSIFDSFVKLFDEAGRLCKDVWKLVKEEIIDPIADVVKDWIVERIKDFLKTIASVFCSILCKRWLLEYVNPLAVVAGHPVGEWPGTWENWTLYHYPTSPLIYAETPIDMIPPGAASPGLTCGTGPYILDWLQCGYGYSIVRNPDYWGGWPSANPNPPYPDSPLPPSGIKPKGYVERMTVIQVSVSTGITNLINGDADFAYVPRARVGELHVDGNKDGPTLPGIRLNYPIPELAITSLHFTFDIEPTPTNEYGIIYPADELHPDGIPRNFFNNTYVRKAFAHLINFTMIIKDLQLGEAYQPNTFAPSGLPYVNPTIPKYYYDEEKAAYYFDQAYFGGQKLTDVGFTLTITYELGDKDCEAMAKQLADDLRMIAVIKGWDFTIVVEGVPRARLLRDIRNHKPGIYFYRWKPDPVNIHDYAFTYAHSRGPLASAQRYMNPHMDELIERGVSLPDGIEKQTIYNEIEELFYEDVPTIPLFIAVERVYMRDWVQGYYYNPTAHGIYAYHLWKWPMTETVGAEGYFVGDVNFDGKVSMDDIIAIVNSFGSYAGKGGMPVIHPRWNFYCDVDDTPYYRWRDRKIGMGDIVTCLASFGKTSIPWHP